MWSSDDGWKVETVGGRKAVAGSKRRRLEQPVSTAPTPPKLEQLQKAKEKLKAPPAYVVQPAAGRAAHAGKFPKGRKGFVRWLESYGTLSLKQPIGTTHPCLIATDINVTFLRTHPILQSTCLDGWKPATCTVSTRYWKTMAGWSSLGTFFRQQSQKVHTKN